MRRPSPSVSGEIGLDYYWNKESRDLQIACFKKQIELALEYDKPVVIHSREAAADTLEVVSGMYGAGSPWEMKYGRTPAGTIPRKGVMLYGKARVLPRHRRRRDL